MQEKRTAPTNAAIHCSQSVRLCAIGESMIVLGIDPGATVGLALIEVPPVGRPKWLWHGDTRRVQRAIVSAMYDASASLGVRVPVDAIAIEEVRGYVYEKQRGAELFKTSQREGRLIEQAESYGLAPIMVSRADWRKALCGNGSADDAKVKRALELQAVGMPKRTNAHVRDAAGVAIVGARMAMAARRKTA